MKVSRSSHRKTLRIFKKVFGTLSPFRADAAYLARYGAIKQRAP